ncbi:MAG: phosphoenolpyruvate synthase PpsA [Deltaproteobacteria bacterium]|nr:MAG: phosphoenolpyruvate synthase PpsA [Deltaproteobacteria bacterium]
MISPRDASPDNFDLSFKVFHELMAEKVSDILLLSSPYDAFILEEEGRLAERIIKEYRGLNLSRPPRLTWVSTAREAFSRLAKKNFDFVITTPRVDGSAPHTFARKAKKKYPKLPIFLLTHNYSDMMMDMEDDSPELYDRTLFWNGNADLLLAQVKNVEDRWNIARDTELARVRVIIMVEDSPYYYSSVLPLLYKEIVLQTQAVMEDALNEEHRLLRMRARPKILTAVSYEEAERLYRQYKPYLLSVLSDARFPKNGEICPSAGVELLSMIKKESPDVQLLMFSSEEENREKAEAIPAMFVTKNDPALHTQIRSFFVKYLGFGEFIFRMPDGREVARASNLRGMEKALPSIPDESLLYHAQHNHFSTWLMARAEIMLATKLRPYKIADFSSVSDIRNFLVACFHERRKGRQRGIITDFDSTDYDPDIDFVKIGRGSLGGKARGLAFLSMTLKESDHLQEMFPDVNIMVPETMVVSTEGFDAFMTENRLDGLTASDPSDEEVFRIFLKSRFPDWIYRDLKKYLEYKTFPLAVRSSSLLEDAYFHPFAGIYRTYMLPNNDPSLTLRIEQLVKAITCVYASTFLKDSRSFARNTLHRTEEEKMAVVIQRLMGQENKGFFYPTLSGVAKSFNFYPVAPMTSEDGIAHIAMGLGKTVVEGMDVLRFCPKYPELLPQFSTVDDILKNAQRYAYALNMNGFSEDFVHADDATLARLDIDDIADHPAVRYLSSTYLPQDNRIRDAWHPDGYPVMTFARILKHNAFPLPEIIVEMLKMGRKGLGEHVEIEFCAHHYPDQDRKTDFSLVQIRPMTIRWQKDGVKISRENMDKAVIYSDQALGLSRRDRIRDIIYVKPDRFDPNKTVEMVSEIGALNAKLEKAGRKYLLIGPGRWGSADRWLGIPVTWRHIAGVDTIIETSVENFKADPSQGSHFFHNITSLGIGYITVRPESGGVINWQWLDQLPIAEEKTYVRHVAVDRPMCLMIDGRSASAVLLPDDEEMEEDYAQKK